MNLHVWTAASSYCLLSSLKQRLQEELPPSDEKQHKPITNYITNGYQSFVSKANLTFRTPKADRTWGEGLSLIHDS